MTIALKLETEEKRETTTGFHVRLNQRILDLTDSSSYLDVRIDFLEYQEWCSPEREELEVRSTSKLTIMNGGKMEPGATKTMFSLSYLGCFSKKKIHF